jgi:hypothetical protein
MNGTMRRLLGRSVQLTVMATPPTSVADAVAEARRRHGSAVSFLSGAARTVSIQPAAALGA